MRFQLIISICAAIIPLFAFLLLLPKKKKKSKKENKPSPAKEKKEEPVLSEKDSNAENAKRSYEDYKSSLDEEFKRYAQKKVQTSKKPERKVETIESPNLDIGISRPGLANVGQNKESKTVVDEFNDTSDDLKALILSGFLDKKDYKD